MFHGVEAGNGGLSRLHQGAVYNAGETNLKQTLRIKV